MSYTVKLGFTSGDKTYSVLKGSIESYVGTEGKHATQSTPVKIQSAECAALLLVETEPMISAKLYHNSTLIFDGYVRPYRTIGAKGATEDPVSLQIMDATEYMHVVTGTDIVYNNKTIAQLVALIYAASGATPTLGTVPADLSTYTLDRFRVAADEYWDEILSELLYEYGYDFVFTPGACTIQKTTIDAAPNQSITDIRNAYKVERSDNVIDGTIVEYKKVAYRQNVSLYSDDTRFDSTKTGMFGTHKEGNYYNGLMHDNQNTPPAGNLVSWNLSGTGISGLDASSVLAVENVSFSYSIEDEDGITLTQHFDQDGSDLLTGARWWLHYNGTFNRNLGIGWGWVIRAHGDITYLVDGNWQYKCDGADPKKFSARYISNEAAASAMAGREYKRFKVCHTKYTFDSLTDYNVGEFYNLEESTIGVDTIVRIISKSLSSDGVYSYQCEGADSINLSVTVRELQVRDIASVANVLTLETDKTSLFGPEDVAQLTAVGFTVSMAGMTFRWYVNGLQIPGTASTIAIKGSQLSVGYNTIKLEVLEDGVVMVSRELQLEYISTQKVSYGTALEGENLARGAAGSFGDYYVNTNTWNLYRCIQAGNEHTAIWEFIKNTQGEPVTVNSFKYEIEYGLSSSPTEFVFADGNYGYDTTHTYGYDSDNEYGFENIGGWSSNYDNWYKGLYVWQRIKVTDAEGNIEYQEPTYAEATTISLINGCVFDILLTDSDGDGNTHTWEKNLASASGTVDVQFNLSARSYGSIASFESALQSVVITPYKGQTALTPIAVPTPLIKTIDNDTKTVTFVYGFTFAKKADYDSLVINADITDSYLHADGTTWSVDSQASESMNAVDVTEYFAYGGIHSNSNGDDSEANDYFTLTFGGVYEGYNYIDSTNKTIRYYNGSSWEVLNLSFDNAGTILSNAEADFWTLFESLSDEDKEVMWDTYGYKKEIISCAMATSKLIMYGQGVIASANISTNASQDIDEDGFLTKTGYRLEGQSGTIRSKDSFFNSAKAKSLTVFEQLNLQKTADTSYAQIIHPALKTYDASEGDIGSGASDSLNAWAISDIYNLNSQYQNGWIYPTISDANYDYISVQRSSPKSNPSGNVVFVRDGLSPLFSTTYTYPVYGQNCSVGIYFYMNGGSCTLNGTMNLVVDGVTVYSATYNNQVLSSGSELVIPKSSGGVTPFPLANISNGSTISLTGSFFTLNSGTISVIGDIWSPLQQHPCNASGVWLHPIGGSWINYGTNKFYKFGLSLSNVFTESSIYNSLNNLNYCIPSNIASYYQYTTTGGITVTLDTNVAYSATGTLYDINGNTYSVSMLTVLIRGQQISLGLADGSSVTMSTSDGGIYYGTGIKVEGKQAGIETKAIFPSADLTYDLGRAGSDARQYRNIYCLQVYPSSSKKLKDNIRDFTDNAVELLNSVRVTSYNYKAELEDYKNGVISEEDVVDTIGFIADDTDPRLSGKRQNRLLITNCIGVLIKAVQELSAEIDRLKGGNA